MVDSTRNDHDLGGVLPVRYVRSISSDSAGSLGARLYQTIVTMSIAVEHGAVSIAALPVEKSHVSPHTLTIGVLLLAAVLRFWGLQTRGLLEWDGAYYLGVAKTMLAGIHWLSSRLLHIGGDVSLASRLLQEGVAMNTNAKPGFILPVFLGVLVAGPSEMTILAISAFAGIATVYLTGRIASMLFGVRAALLAMLFLGLSFTHLSYSRSGLSVSVSTLFLCLGWFGYLRSLSPSAAGGSSQALRLFWSGCAIGYAFTCHYNLFWIPLVFAGFFAFEVNGHTPIRLIAGRFAMFCLGVIAPLVCFEALTRLAQWMIVRSSTLSAAAAGRWGTGHFMAYFEDLRFQTLGQGHSFSWHDPLFYFRLIAQWEGVGVLCALIVSLCWSLWRLRNHWTPGFISCLALAWIPIVIWSGFYYPVARTVGVAAPAMAILLAAMGDAVYGWGARRFGATARVVGVAFIFLITLCSWRHVQPIMQMRSGMPEAVQFMRTHGSVKHLSSEFPLSRLYVGRTNVLDTWVSFSGKNAREVLQACDRDGYRFILMSVGRFTSDPALVHLLEGVKPVFQTPHSFHLFSYEYFDVTEGVERQRRMREAPEEIQIYNIRDVLNAHA